MTVFVSERAAAADTAEVTALVKQSGTSFYHGMKILPAARRNAMYGIYAFCRVVDDIADDDAPLPAKRKQLQAWRDRIAGIYTGTADGAICRVLKIAVETYHLREADFIAIIDGMEMDAGAPIVAPPMPVLDLYCDRVAAAVGRLSVRVFGDESDQAQDVAYALGRALQFTNILRDVKEDAARGRLYLPHEFLVDEGIPLAPAAAAAAKNLAKVCTRMALLAERYFDQADAAMALCNRRAMRPARLMAASYRPLLAIMRRRRFDIAAGRASLPKWRKLALAAQVFLP
jgi:squalene synthase HpnD